MGDTSGCEHGRGAMQGCIECEEAARARIRALEAENAELREVAETVLISPIQALLLPDFEGRRLMVMARAVLRGEGE